MDYKATIFQKGGKKVYTFPFPYLSKQFVKARYERGSTSTPLEYNRDYSIDGQTLSLHTEGSAEDILCIYRQTPTGSLVDFNDGSILLASELDKMSIQLLHVAEEQSDRLYLSGMFADADGWEARGKRIKNLLSPSDEGDAVTLGYLNSVGVAKQDEMQRIEQSVTEKATNVRLAESRVTSAAEGIRRDLNAQDIIRQEISNNKIIVDSMYKGVIAEEQRAAQHVTKAQEHADAAAASASAAAQSAQKSEHEASEAFSYVGIVKDFTRQAAESAKKAAASAGLEGLVETKHIADGAVTKAKLDASVQALLSTPLNFKNPKMTPILDKARSTFEEDLFKTKHYKGDIFLLEDFIQYDAVFIVWNAQHTDAPRGRERNVTLWASWELAYAFEHFVLFNIFKVPYDRTYYIRGSAPCDDYPSIKTPSTRTTWKQYRIDAFIEEIYGIKY